MKVTTQDVVEYIHVYCQEHYCDGCPFYRGGLCFWRKLARPEAWEVTGRGEHAADRRGRTSEED